MNKKYLIRYNHADEMWEILEDGKVIKTFYTGEMAEKEYIRLCNNNSH